MMPPTAACLCLLRTMQRTCLRALYTLQKWVQVSMSILTVQPQNSHGSSSVMPPVKKSNTWQTHSNPQTSWTSFSPIPMTARSPKYSSAAKPTGSNSNQAWKKPRHSLKHTAMLTSLVAAWVSQKWKAQQSTSKTKRPIQHCLTCKTPWSSTAKVGILKAA